MALRNKFAFVLLRNRFINKYLLNSLRNLSSTSINRVKEIKEIESGDTLTIQAEIKESRRKPYLLKIPNPHDACPLCRLNLKLKYTDVLILSQFVQPDGIVLAKEITGLCHRKHKEVETLVEQAQNAGLMAKAQLQLDPIEEKIAVKDRGWEKCNTYFETKEELKLKEMRMKDKHYYEKPVKHKVTLQDVLSYINEHKY